MNEFVPVSGKDLLTRCFACHLIKPIEVKSKQQPDRKARNLFLDCRITSLPCTGCLKKKYPLLTGNRNEIIRHHYSPRGQLNLSIFNLDPHNLHLRIVHQTPEKQACKVKIYSAPETRGFVKGPSHNLLSQACCT